METSKSEISGIPYLIEAFIGKKVIEADLPRDRESKLVLKLSTKQLLLETTRRTGNKFYELVNGILEGISSTSGIQIRYSPFPYTNRKLFFIPQEEIYDKATKSFPVGEQLRINRGNVGDYFKSKLIYQLLLHFQT